MAHEQPAVFSPQSYSGCEFSKVFLIKLAPEPDWTTSRWAEPCFPRGKPFLLSPIWSLVKLVTWIILENLKKEITLESSMQLDGLCSLIYSLITEDGVIII